MKYRIKITTFHNERQEFRSYVKKWGLWFGLDYEGKSDLTYSMNCNNRDRALNNIDNHANGSSEKKSIDFEYLTKKREYLK